MAKLRQKSRNYLESAKSPKSKKREPYSNFLRQTSCTTFLFPFSTCSLALEKPSTSPTELNASQTPSGLHARGWYAATRLVEWRHGVGAYQMAPRLVHFITQTSPIRYCMSADICSMRVKRSAFHSHYVGSDPNVMPYPSEIFIVWHRS